METTVVTVMNFLSVEEDAKNNFILEDMSKTYQDYLQDDSPTLLQGMAEVLALSIETLIICGELTQFNLAIAIYYQIDSWDNSQTPADNLMRKLTQE